MDHDSNYNGSDIQNINDRKPPHFSGGEYAWDLITRHDQATATGLYLFTVENLDMKSVSYGVIKEG